MVAGVFCLFRLALHFDTQKIPEKVYAHTYIYILYPDYFYVKILSYCSLSSPLRSFPTPPPQYLSLFKKSGRLFFKIF